MFCCVSMFCSSCAVQLQLCFPSLSHPRAQWFGISVAQPTVAQRAHITRVVHLESLAGLERLQLSSRCNRWQLEMDSSNGGAVKPSDSGRKTFQIFTRWSCLRVVWDTNADFCRLNVSALISACHEVQTYLFWLKLSQTSKYCVGKLTRNHFNSLH